MRLGLSLKLPGLTAWAGYPVPYLFQNGEQGWWYDPSDFSTLFQDEKGTTPVTAVEQPCSLMLDKRLGLTLGSELVTNGTFDTDSDWTKGTGWTISGGKATHASGSAADLAQIMSTKITTGKTYLVMFTVSDMTAGTLSLYLGGVSGGTAVSGNGSYTRYLVNTISTGNLGFGASSTFDGSIDNISVRELPGNHAYTPAAASTSRPTVSARVNLLTKTEQFDDAAWTKSQQGDGVIPVVTANAGLAPDGTMTADRLQVSRSTIGNPNRSQVRQSASPALVSTFPTITARLWYKSFDGTDQQFSVVNSAYSFGNTAFTATSEWQQAVLTFTGGLGSPNMWIGLHDSTNSSLSADILIWGADLRVANDGVGLPPYQRVNTASDYDAGPEWPKYLRFDQSNDYMLTNSIDFSGTDKVTVAAGVRKLSDAAIGVIMELSVASGSNSGSFGVWGPGTVANNYQVRSRGTVDSNFVVSGYSAPITNVLTMVGDIASPLLELLINGTSVNTQTTSQGTGNYGNYPLYIGARAGTSLFFGGRLYGTVGRGALNNDQQNAALTAYLNTKTRAF
jgi:hypothetical protein